MFISTLSLTTSKICTLLYFHMVGKEIMISVLHLSLSWNHIKRFTSQKSSALPFEPATVWQSLNGQTHKNELHLCDKNATPHFAFLQGNMLLCFFASNVYLKGLKKWLESLHQYFLWNVRHYGNLQINSQPILSIENWFYRLPTGSIDSQPVLSIANRFYQ